MTSTGTRIKESSNVVRKRAEFEVKMNEVLSDVIESIKKDEVVTYKHASANISRIFVKNIKKDMSLLVPFIRLDFWDAAYILDARIFVGDPVELRAELDRMGSQLVLEEHENGYRLAICFEI